MGEQGETEREGSRVEEKSLPVQDGEREQEPKEKFSSNMVAVDGDSGDGAREVVGDVKRAKVEGVNYRME